MEQNKAYFSKILHRFFIQKSTKPKSYVPTPRASTIKMILNITIYFSMFIKSKKKFENLKNLLYPRNLFVFPRLVLNLILLINWLFEIFLGDYYFSYLFFLNSLHCCWCKMCSFHPMLDSPPTRNRPRLSGRNWTTGILWLSDTILGNLQENPAFPRK